MDKNQIREAYKNTPQEIKEVMSADETTEFITSLKDKYQLHIDQIGSLVDQITLIMVGLMRPNEFIPAVAKNLNIEIDKAQQIAKEINDKIFAPVRESLKKVHTNPPAEKGVAPDDRPDDSSMLPPSSVPNKESDPLVPFLSSANNKDQAPVPRPYTQDPYLEPVE